MKLVTGPIALLAVAAFCVVLISLVMGAQQANDLALGRQRATIEHALEQHGRSLSRELRVQTVWSEAFDRTLAHNTVWMRAFFGLYLRELFGYDRVYVLSGNDKFVYGYAGNRDSRARQFAEIEPSVRDLIAAVRSPGDAGEDYNIVSKAIAISDDQTVVHSSVADVRNIAGTPSMVVVSTIVPDRPRALAGEEPYLLIAIEDLDTQFIRNLSAVFEFADLHWLKGPAPVNYWTDEIKSVNGAKVGKLAWRSQAPGWEFVRRVGLGLGVALVLLAVLTVLLMRWGRSQAEHILESEAEARSAARTDALTSLPNRLGIGEALPAMVAKAKSEQSTLAVLLIDIDQFKEINDDFGHAFGDAVLVEIANRLKRVLKPDAMLGRAGGDDFMILAPGLDATAASGLAARIVAALVDPVALPSGVRVYAGASVGYAISPRDGEESDDLARRVELALAKAKELGGRTAVAFAPEMDLELSHRRVLESALRSALSNDAIEVLYQPVVDPKAQRVLAVEALMRWTDPLLGPVSPEQFIPIAEETGLIQKLGEHVLRRAVVDGLAWPDVNIAVNVSAVQIHHGDMVSVVRDVLGSSRFPPERLEIEITESVLVADERRADEQIKGLQGLGVRVALDDFGSGYSSLLYLRKFGFDKLKIDRSFIEEIGKSADSMVILDSIIKLGLELNMTVTAEGVERVEQQRWLSTSGCHQLQGFLLSRPLTFEQVTAFIESHDSAALAGRA